jgi:hypothetical protein
MFSTDRWVSQHVFSLSLARSLSCRVVTTLLWLPPIPLYKHPKIDSLSNHQNSKRQRNTKHLPLLRQPSDQQSKIKAYYKLVILA